MNMLIVLAMNAGWCHIKSKQCDDTSSSLVCDLYNSQQGNCLKVIEIDTFKMAL